MVDESGHTEATAAPDAAAGADFTAAPDEPPLPATAAALAGKAKDLQALRDAVVDTASVGAGLWFSYLFVLLYLLIAVGGVTHRDLFLQSPVKLPFLNVDLPLLGFFWLGPAIFLIVHAYVLLHFALLAGKVGDFDAELKAQITDEEVRGRLRRQLPSNIFVQFLAGSREVRSGVMGFLLRLIAQISLVIGPVALLVFFELQFLPYHDWAITWWHRIAVLADIALLWTLWPSIARGERAGLSWRDLRRVKILALAFASLVPVLLVFTIATFPGEWLDDTLWKDGKDKPSWHPVRAKFDSAAKIAAISETVSLRARHLEGAVLIGAKLRKADFTAAQLQRAQLDHSDLRGAKFECAATDPEPQQCAQLQGASLDLAQLQGASLVLANLQGAWLHQAKLQGASLKQLELQGASLAGAKLQGAALRNVWVWRTDDRWAVWEDARVESPHTEEMSAEEFEKLKQMIAEEVPDGNAQRGAMERIETLDPTIWKAQANFSLAEEVHEIAKVWKARADSSPGTEAYEKRLAEIWIETGCAAKGAPYVIRGLLVQFEGMTQPFLDWQLGLPNPQVTALAKSFLDEEHCPGARGLTEAEKAKLIKIRDRDAEKARLKAIHDRSPPPAPKQQ